jgi:hypothetical protein
MSARLNMNEIRHFSWKGRTFNQITSTIQMNKGIIVGTDNYLRPRPLKIHRREIITNAVGVCNSRLSTSIDLFNQPNGTIVNSKSIGNQSNNGLVNTLDFGYTNNTTEVLGTCTANKSIADNARRRVRSSGNIKRQFDISTKTNSYCTSTNQYLISRSRTFQQNQYHYIRKGDARAKPGDSLSSQNTYSSTGECAPNFFIPTQFSFKYQWINGLEFSVDFPSGYYNINTLNDKFKDVMVNNLHYLVRQDTKSAIFLLNIAYNNILKKIELQSYKINNIIQNEKYYTYPLDPVQISAVFQSSWRIPEPLMSGNTRYDVTLMPVFIIPNNPILESAIGFTAGRYPNYQIVTENNTNPTKYPINPENPQSLVYPPIIEIGNNTNTSISLDSNYGGDNAFEIFVSSTSHELQPAYRAVHYKPSNPGFAKQGGVSSGEVTSRARYNAITNSAGSFYNSMGSEVANALAYGVPSNGYTIKDKMGYPNNSTPVFSKYSNEVRKCPVTYLRNG